MSNNFIDLYDKTDIKDIIPLVAFLVPEMDLGVIKYFLRLAIIQFAKDTAILKRTFMVDTHDNTCDYYLDVGDGYVVHRLNRVKLNDCCLCVTEDCDCKCGDYEYTQGKITFCEPLCETDELEVTVILVPKMDSCDIDSEIPDNWMDALLERFKYYIYGGNDERWKNMTDHRLALREYERIRDRAKAEYMCSNVSGKIVRLTR